MVGDIINSSNFPGLITAILIMLFLVITPASSVLNIEPMDTSPVSENGTGEVPTIPETTVEINENTVQEVGSAPGMSRGSRETFEPIVSDDRVAYAIITADEFKDELAPLATWKTRTGVAAKIFTLEDIYNDYTGVDKAQQVHNFLRDLYSKSDYLQWVLLGGDADADTNANNPPLPYVPSRYLYSGGGSYGVNDYYWSDVYYAGLSHNWDLDGDGIFGEFSSEHPYLKGSGINLGTKGEESDLDFEVYVGRLPADTGAEMTTMVNKILNYEKSPEIGDWMRTAVMWGGLMEAPNVEETYDETQDNAYEIKHDRVMPLIPSSMLLKEYYDYPQLQGGQYTPATDNLNRNNAITSVNNGASIINFAGQAYYEGIALIEYNHAQGTYGLGNPFGFDELYWYSDGGSATNGGKLPLVYMSGCDAAAFNYTDNNKDKSQERMLTNPNGGAIGVISSTGHTYRGEEKNESVGNWWMDEYFWKLFFQSGYYQQGKALYELKTKYTEDIENGAGKLFPTPVRSNTYGYLLLGDPEIDIWTAKPRAMSIDVTDLYVGKGEAVVTVRDFLSGAPIEGALVNIMNYQMYVQGYTNSTGVCTIPIEPLSTGAVEVVVTVHNYKPLESQDYAITYKPVDLIIDSSNIWLEKTPALDGDDILVFARIYNDGGTDLTGSATVRFYLGDPDDFDTVQLGIDRTVSSLYTGNFQTVSVTWNVEYRPEPYDIYVYIDPDNMLPEYTRDNNKAFITNPVFSSDLMIDETDIVFPEGTLVGEQQNITANITIHNNGWVDAVGIKVNLFDGEPGSKNRIVTSSPSEMLVPMIYRNSSESVKVVFNLKGGSHSVYAFVDPDNSTFEMNEGNNIAFGTIKVNYAPDLHDLTDITMYEDTKVVKGFDLKTIKYVYDRDNETDEMMFSVKSVAQPEDLKVIIADNRYVNIEPAENFSSSKPIEVVIQVSDGFSVDTDSFNVTVKPVRDEPYIEQMEMVTGKSGENVVFTVNATDPDGDPLYFTDDSDLFEINYYIGEINFTAEDSMVGTHTIQVFVTDGDLKSTMTFELKILARDNNAPSLTHINDFRVSVGDTETVPLEATDPDGDTLTFSVDPPLSLFTISKKDSDSAWLNITPNKNDVGEDKILVIVSDGIETDEQWITITIVDTSKESNDKGFSLNPYVLLAIIISIVIIVLAFILLKKRKEQTERDMKAWESMGSVDLRDSIKREGTRKEGELSVIEQELLERGEGAPATQPAIIADDIYTEPPAHSPETGRKLKPIKKKKLVKQKKQKALPPVVEESEE